MMGRHAKPFTIGNRLSRKFFGDGIPYVWPLSHARAVLNNAWSAVRINAIVFQPLGEGEEIWVGNGIGVAHDPRPPRQAALDQFVASSNRLRHLALHIGERCWIFRPSIPPHTMGMRDVER